MRAEDIKNSEGWNSLNKMFERKCLDKHPNICRGSHEVGRIRGMLETYCGLPDIIPFEIKKILITSDLDSRAKKDPRAAYSALKILQIENIDCYKVIGYPTERLKSRF